MTDHDDQSAAVGHQPARYWLISIGVVLVLAAINVVLATFIPQNIPQKDYYEVIVFGWCAGQFLLLGVWASLGPGTVLFRSVWVITALAIVTLSGNVRFTHQPSFFSDREDSEPAWIDLGTAFGYLCAFAAIAVGAYAIGRFGGWWITTLESTPSDLGRRAQFGLRFAFGMMTAWAGILGFGAQFAYGNPGTILRAEAMFIIAIICAGVSLPSLAISLQLLMPQLTVQRVASALVVTLVAISLMTLLVGILGSSGDDLAEVFLGMALIVGGAIASSSMATLILRWAGFRLQRVI